jgi:hypothetical protein
MTEYNRGYQGTKDSVRAKFGIWQFRDVIVFGCFHTLRILSTEYLEIQSPNDAYSW